MENNLHDIGKFEDTSRRVRISVCFHFINRVESTTNHRVFIITESIDNEDPEFKNFDKFHQLCL